MTNKKLWGGRFNSAPHELVEALSESISFDSRLYRVDIQGSKAHAKALEKIGILNAEELKIVLAGLDKVLGQIESGSVEFATELEDIHMNVESILTKEIGDLGKKIHTGRSRNDQVATDLRLYVMLETQKIISYLRDFQNVLVKQAENNLDVILPGFTHLQIAQPVLFSHHMMAYFEMFERDVQRLLDCYKRTDSLILGSAALAGSTFGQDRELIAKELGFSNVSSNSMDAVSDRDYVIEFLSAASMVMMHLSRFSEEIILWMTPQFGYVNVDDSYTTGSSIMPQKRNPDVAELTRGKTGRVYGNLMSLLTITKGLPLTYNRDLQEDKEPLFDTIDTLNKVIPVFSLMIESLTVNKERMMSQSLDGFSSATDLADFLAKNDLPFREAHHVVGALVKYCEDNDKKLHELTKDEMYNYVPESIELPEDIMELLSSEACIKARNIIGGTSTTSVQNAINQAKKILKKDS